MPVRNLKKEFMDTRDWTNVRIDRQSNWGNPYRIGDPHPITKKPMSREDVIFEHRQDFWAEMKKKPEFCRRVKGLKGMNLWCHCTPFKCHGHTLERAAEWLCTEEGENWFKSTHGEGL